MLLVLQIALGIVLAVVILRYLAAILTVGVALAVLAIAGIGCALAWTHLSKHSDDLLVWGGAVTGGTLFLVGLYYVVRGIDILWKSLWQRLRARATK